MRKSKFLAMMIVLLTTFWLVSSFTISAKVTAIDEVQTAVKKQLRKTELAPLIPNKLPIEKQQFLTAKTTVNKNSYEVKYYQFNKKYKVNDVILNKANNRNLILRITAKKYATKLVAKQNVESNIKPFNKGNKLLIARGLYGYRDAGVGSSWLTWGKAKWTFTVQSTTENSQKGLKKAQQMAKELKINNLPKQATSGVIYLSTEGNYYIVKWQQDKVVYKIEGLTNSSKLIDVITSIN